MTTRKQPKSSISCFKRNLFEATFQIGTYGYPQLISHQLTNNKSIWCYTQNRICGSKMKIWKPPSAQFYLNAIFNTNSRPEKNLNFVRFHMESAKKHEKPVVFWNFPDQNGHNLNVFLAGLKVKYFLKSTFHC